MKLSLYTLCPRLTAGDEHLLLAGLDGHAHWLLDESGFLDCDAAALRMFGLTSKGEFTHAAMLSPLQQADGTPSRIAVRERIAKALEKGGECFEWLYKRKDGEIFPVEVWLAPMMVRGKRVLLATAREIDDQPGNAAINF